MSDVRCHASAAGWMRTRRRARRALTILLAIWLPLSIARESFDLVGRLWLPVALDLFQILSCILGLFAACQQRSALIAVFSISALVSTAYSVGLIAWYANLVSGWDRTQPLLSAGLPFGYSFFLRHTPLCSSRFNLVLSKWEQDAGCIVPYYAVEVLQASLHAILSLIAFLLSIFALLEIRRETRNGKSSTPHTTSTVDKVQPSCGSALAEATRLATAEAPNGLHRGGARNHLRLKGANGTATITAPDSLNDLSGYMNSSYESAADRELTLNYAADGNNDNNNNNNNIDQRLRKYALLKESGRQNRQKMARKRDALVQNQCQESKSVPSEMPSAVGKISPQEESYSSAATVEMNGSTKAKTNSSSPPVVNPPLSNPPPPPLPFLEELKKSHPYTAIVHKQRPLSRRREPLNSSGEAPGPNERSIAGGGSTRIYAKNTTTNAGGSALGRSHQLRSSLSRLRQHVEEEVGDESLSSEYLFPNKPAPDGGGQLRCRHLPLGGIEGAVERMSENHDSSSLGDYLVSKGNANLTQLISFDPKSTIPLKVQGHRNSSAESSDEENDANQSPLKEHLTSSHKRTEPSIGSIRLKGHQIGDSDEESLPSTKAPILQAGLYRPSPSSSLTENNMSPTAVARHAPPSALLRRRMPYEESEFQISQVLSHHRTTDNAYEPCDSEFGVGLVRSPTAPVESSSHVAKSSDWKLAGIPHHRPISASGFQKPTSSGSDGRPNTSYYCAGGSALERLQSGVGFQSRCSGSTTAFPSRPKSLLEAFNHSIYECVENRPLASTAFPVRQDEPEHLVAGVSVASAVSLSKANATSSPYVNCPPSTFASPYSFIRQRPLPTNFPIAQAPPLYCNDEGLLV